MTHYSDAILRAEEYSKRRRLSIEKQIGSGIQGVVFSTDCGTAVKSLIRREFYVRERDVYLRLTDRKIESICGFSVPRLVNFHDELLVIEMQLVTRPFVVDFASAYLDEEPPYANDPEIMAAWEAEKREQFEDRWAEVQRILSAFRGHGIYLADVKPRNIEFAD